jgi:hypothetical protein
MSARSSVLVAAIAVTVSAAASGCEPAREASTPHAPETHAARAAEPGRKFDPEHRWDLSDTNAVKRLEGTKFGEQEINEFWTRKGWRLTKHEEHYMATVAELVRQGKVTKVSHWGQTPFDPIYQTLQRINIEGVTIDPQTEFWMEFCENEDELKVGNPRFLRVSAYEEEHQGHADQASDNHTGERRPSRQGKTESHEDKD